MEGIVRMVVKVAIKGLDFDVLVVNVVVGIKEINI